MAIFVDTVVSVRIIRRLYPHFRGAAKRNGGRSFSALTGTIDEGDIVILRRPEKGRENTPILTSPLKKGVAMNTHFGTLKMDDIIGRKNRDTVTSSTGKWVRVHIPTLAEYVTLTPRIVTPIYPADANLIVSLLDIHVTPPTGSCANDAPLEILEAGTGHGSLTLHLSRAIHAANEPYVPEPAENLQTIKGAAEGTDVSSQSNLELPEDPVETAIEDDSTTLPPPDTPSTPSTAPEKEKSKPRRRQSQTPTSILPHPPTPSPSLATWKTHRRAILHTLDLSPTHSHHAQKIVFNFRNSIYYHNIDFHVHDISSFISSKQAEKSTEAGGQIFNHILLDLPGVHDHIVKAAEALRDDGTLIVFAPSITQVGACVEVIRKAGLPLSYEQVVELGQGYSGGKQWDVRAVKTAVSQKVAMAQEREFPGKKGFWGWVKGWFGGGVDEKGKKEDDGEWVMVCRPSVGHRVVGGGFVGVWRRKRGWKGLS